MLDFHNHLMPGVDDGAASLDESRSGLAVMQEQGITTIVTTPHLRASLTDQPRELDSYLRDLDIAFEALQKLAESEFPELRIERAWSSGWTSVTRLERPATASRGNDFVLMEFPHMSIPPNSVMAVRQLSESNVRPIIAHPERYSNMSTNFELIESWRDAGAFIQINCGSLIGHYGSRARHLVWQIIERGWGDYLSSDYHSRGKCPIRDCAAALHERGGGAQLQQLTVTNPQRMLRSERPLPVEPLEEIQLGFWRKLLRR